MPIYEFQCNRCGNTQEEICTSMKRKPRKVECSCGCRMVPIMSSPAISKLAGTPPSMWKPLKKSKPKSYVPDPAGK